MATTLAFASLIGEIFSRVERTKGTTDSWQQRSQDRLEFQTEDGRLYVLRHEQDCCETVTIEDICGDVEDLVGASIIRAEEVTNKFDGELGGESNTWTFYHLCTIKGSVTIRWHGSSNGYYSENVNLYEETLA